MIAERGVHKKIGISNSNVTTLRWKLANGIAVSLERKLELLQRSGWRQDERGYSRKDLVDAVKCALRAGARAKEWGAEYVVEKFLNKK